MLRKASLPPRGDLSLNALIPQPAGTTEPHRLREWKHHHPGSRWKSSSQNGKPWGRPDIWPCNPLIGDRIIHNENSTYQPIGDSFGQATS